MLIANQALVGLSTAIAIAAASLSAQASNICYSVRVQGDSNFRPEVCDGTIAGTTGQSLRLEQIKIRGMESGANVCYRVHVQDIGWAPKVCQNTVAGQKDKRIEAIEIVDTGLPANLGVYYQVHVQNYGWMPIRWDGGLGGTTGKSLRMEAIAIAVQPRSPCPDTNWYNFQNGDGLEALANPVYAGQPITCDYYSSVFSVPRPVYMEYHFDDGIIQDNGWYIYSDSSGNVWATVVDHANNILDAWWDKPDGSSVHLGAASRNWTTSPYGTGAPM
jgi:hypothetical protein